MAPNLRIAYAFNKSDEIGFGALELDVRDPAGRVATQYRLARHPDDLAHMHWRNVIADTEIIPWQFATLQLAARSTTYAEIAYDTGPSVIVSAADNCYARLPGEVRPCAPKLNPEPNYLLRIRPTNDRDGWPLTQYGDAIGGNNFRPLDVHKDGYFVTTDHTRMLDVGETPDDIILAHLYARHFQGCPNYLDLSVNQRIAVAKLGSANLDLNGAIIVWAVVSTHASGHRGRWHLMRPLQVGLGSNIMENWESLPSGSHPDWRCSFSSTHTIAQMPQGPELSQCEALELVIRMPESGGAAPDLVSPPTGIIKIAEFSVRTSV